MSSSRSALLFSLLFVVFIGLLIYLYKKSANKSQNLTTPFLENHITALQHRNYEKAYSTFSTGWKQKISLESYQEQWVNKCNKNGNVARWELYDVKEGGNIFDGSTSYYCIVKLYFERQKAPFWVYYQLETNDKNPLVIIHAGQKSSGNFVDFEVW